MFAIRREDARNWFFPWLSSGCDKGTYGIGTHPDSWPLYEAHQYVNKHRTKEYPLAVYLIRGFIQRKIYPSKDSPWDIKEAVDDPRNV